MQNGSSNGTREALKYEIESNVPLPSKGGKTPRYPLRDLQPGQSFFISAESTPYRVVASRISPLMRRVSIETGRKFTSRRDGNGIRVWRVS